MDKLDVERSEPENKYDCSFDCLFSIYRVVFYVFRCFPGDADACGDGGPASEARLDFPKSVAVAVDRTVYIADGRNVRVINPDGTIHTLVGSSGAGARNGPVRPVPCNQRTLLATTER